MQLTTMSDRGTFDRWLAVSLVVVVCGLAVTVPTCLADEVSGQDHAVVYQRVVSRAIGYLRTKGQSEDGSYSSAVGPGVTSIISAAILRHGRSPDDPLVGRSLKYIERFVKPDGGIYREGSLYRNYETCLAVMCFAEANQDGRYEKVIHAADGFLKDIQWDQGENVDRADPGWGGGGYGKHKRPDLSNTSFLIEALKAAGNDQDSEAIQRALTFVSRCQNLESAQNTTPFGAKINDGGFYYTAAAGGTSQLGKTESGGLRSYPSMTYAGLKSMIFAGVGPEDPRVKAARGYIQKNYDLANNGELGSSGLYYYYHTFAKALAAMGQDTIADAQGVSHHWQSELLQELARQQQADGSWVNKNPRWLEGDANLVTGYALLALSYCRVDH